MNFKPMLAEDVNLKILKYPVLGSPKMNGVRGVTVDGMLKARSLKLFPNRALQRVFRFSAPIDGELIVGSPFSASSLRDTVSVTSSLDGDIRDLRLYVFDIVTPDIFQNRLREATSFVLGHDLLVPVPHLLIYDEAELLKFEEQMLKLGYEGIVLRDPKGKYKLGRSTPSEGGFLRLKRRKTSEAKVTGFKEQLHNANEAKVDNLGYAERSSHQANMVPMGVLGALEVVDLVSGVAFNIGTGFDAQDRDLIWKNRDKYRDKIVSYSYLPVGVKDKPREPAFLGWRMKEDM